MGYFRGVVHGLIIGGAAALLYAPKPGREMRSDLSERLDQVRAGAKTSEISAQDADVKSREIELARTVL